ncbi:ABC transporter substrate-binding protein [Sulfitobacter sp. KE34]|uniref:ABC transporter substrate-binding protein n=1 Tax=unclassified Sulfitobacter TaxID=196795 RepID=UPI0014470EB5|nr:MULTISPECIES: ABC transporter substrate-binding protein [unclassified Sulfitobacter]NKX40241.1 ABC transporter substrate-binding protein [Rhodobacteraceae bacterium R_SAG2]MDF3351612.1 ABC transporter substrate-binding protein [Sulfitobacter sp. KE12]MDF3355285.1 ABC transporter substrate-binding protein [Sulfitobacter sp. KE27]MDF3358933.1 ABC transporter substrate-binding protein [Sulfitobacter sp. KE33]MDF3366357.1 ABC transporter substrate-binding protein [Sulfitobacter sp. Ks34]
MKRSRFKRFAATIGGAIVALSTGFSPALAQETLVIGTISALNGPGSEWGRGVDAGTRIAVTEINDNGGLVVGDTTYMIEVKSYDDGYKPAEAVAAATRLIEQDGVKFIIGPLGSASALAVKPIFEEEGVLALMNSYSPQTLANNPKYVYRVLPTSVEYVDQIVGWMKENKSDLTNVAVVSPNDQTGWDSQKTLVEAYGEAGFEVVGKELFERSSVDFQSIITRLLTTSPDIIELDTTPSSTAGLIIRQARELGFEGLFVKIGGPGVPAIVEAAGKEFAEGTIVYAAADTSSEKYKWMEEEYAKIYSPPMNAFNVFFYDAAHLLFASMQKAGTITDVDAVRDALVEVTPFDGAQGTLVWGGMEDYGNNNQLIVPTFIGRISDGKEEIIDRIDAK